MLCNVLPVKSYTGAGHLGDRRLGAGRLADFLQTFVVNVGANATKVYLQPGLYSGHLMMLPDPLDS